MSYGSYRAINLERHIFILYTISIIPTQKKDKLTCFVTRVHVFNGFDSDDIEIANKT